MIGGSRPIMGWRSRRMDSEIPPAQKSSDPSPNTLVTPGPHMLARISPMNRAIQTRAAPSWNRGSRPILGTGLLYSHLSWHLALGHLETGDAAAALHLF